jgi:glutathione S-transferase
MAITLYHHPYSRAAASVWPLEEVGVSYQLAWTDIQKGEQKQPAFLAKNPMGKIPTLVDGDLVVTESAAIAMYLADRYAPGTLAPALDDPKRGTYYRWICFGPAVIEPAATANLYKWEARPGQVGWGTLPDTLKAIDLALSSGPYVLGETFSMADVVFGGTLRYMTTFKMIEPSPAVASYIARLNQRPALQRADARNQAIAKERGLGH